MEQKWVWCYFKFSTLLFCLTQSCITLNNWILMIHTICTQLVCLESDHSSCYSRNALLILLKVLSSWVRVSSCYSKSSAQHSSTMLWLAIPVIPKSVCIIPWLCCDWRSAHSSCLWSSSHSPTTFLLEEESSLNLLQIFPPYLTPLFYIVGYKLPHAEGQFFWQVQASSLVR